MAPSNKSRAQSSAGQEKTHKKQKGSRSSKANRSGNDLAKQIAEAGGEQADIELVKGAREEQLVQGAVEEDVRNFAQLFLFKTRPLYLM